MTQSRPPVAQPPTAEPRDDAARAEVDAIATAVLGCAGVAGLSAGVFGEIGSYLPGRRVAGVRTDDELVEVHIVAAYGVPIPAIGDAIGEALAPLLAGRSLEVSVDDILLPGEEPAEQGGTDAPAR